jgi:hypothetical protein
MQYSRIRKSGFDTGDIVAILKFMASESWPAAQIKHLKSAFWWPAEEMYAA